MKVLCFHAMMAMLLAAAGLSAQEPYWPCWRGPNHDGKSTETGLLKTWPEEGPPRLWRATGLGKGFSTVAVVGDAIYTAGDADSDLILVALDADGQPRWRQRVDRAWTDSPPGSRATPTVHGDRVYMLSGHGVLACFEAQQGRPVWSRDLRELGGRPGGWGYAESVLILGNLAIAKPGGENCIVAFDKSDGQVIWKSAGFRAGPEYISCVPVSLGRDMLVVTGTSQGLYAVDAKTGRRAWSNDFAAGNTANCPDPAYAGGYLFWANGYGKGGICLKLNETEPFAEPRQLYHTQDMDSHHGGYILHEGYVYGNDGGGFNCLELSTGKLMWRIREPGKGSLTYADGMLYLFGESGGRAALATCSPQGARITGRVAVEGSGPSWAHPVVAGGRLYLRYDDNLYCFDVKAR